MCYPACPGQNVLLDPLLSQQPHFDDLRKDHVAEQRQHQDWPISPRQVSEAKRRGHWGIRQPHSKSHDGYRCGRQRQTRPALQEWNFICTDDVDDQRLRH